MSIENTLERIAVALEKIASRHGHDEATVQPVTITAPDDTAAKAAKAQADKAAAEVKAAADAKVRDAAIEKKKADEAAAKKLAAEAAAKKAADEEAAAIAALEDPAPAASKKITLDDIRDKLKAYRETNGTPAMLAILKEFGAATLSELTEDKFDALMAKIK